MRGAMLLSAAPLAGPTHSAHAYHFLTSLLQVWQMEFSLQLQDHLIMARPSSSSALGEKECSYLRCWQLLCFLTCSYEQVCVIAVSSNWLLLGSV